jgi:hypothetical protein
MAIASLGVHQAGNRLNVVTTFTAPMFPAAERAAASTAVTFEWLRPDGLKEIVSSPHADITGPIAGTVNVDGVTLTTTQWVWKTPYLTQANTYSIRATSTAGLAAAEQTNVTVPSFAPFDTALVAPPLTAGTFPASLVSITDPGNLYAATEANGAFQELAAIRATLGRPDPGQYFRSAGNVAGMALVLDRLYYTPIETGQPTPIDRIGIRITVAGAGSVIRLGVFGAAANGYPGPLVLDAGTVSGAAIASVEIPVSLVVPAGRFWFGAVAQGGVAPSCVGVANASQQAAGFAQTFTSGVGPLTGLTAVTSVNNGLPYQAGVSGPLPATATPGYDSVVVSAPAVLARAA